MKTLSSSLFVRFAGAFLFLIFAAPAWLRAQATPSPTGIPVRFWGGGGAASNWENAPGGLMIQVGGLDSSPGAADGIKTLNGSATGQAGFICQDGSGATHATVYLEPGKRYLVDMVGGWLTHANVGFAAPPGYRVEINGKIRQRFEETIQTPSELYSSAVTLRILGPQTDFSGPAGAASSLADGRLFWQVALGGLLNGSSAGAITLVDAGTSASWNSIFTPFGLHYTAPSDAVEVHWASDRIRQIVAPAAVVDVVTSAEDASLSSNQFEIRFYSPAHASSSGFPRTFTNPAFVTYRIEQGGTATTLKITRTARDLDGTEPDRVTQTSIARTGSWPNYSWSRNEWNTLGASQLLASSYVSGGTASARTTTTTASASNGSTSLEQAHTYSLKSWGEVVASETLGTTNPITRSFQYYDSSSEAGRYGFVKQVVDAGGSWEAYDYWSATNPSTDTGRLKYRFRPFNSAPASATFDPENTAVEVTYFEYALDPFGVKTRPALIETKIQNKIVSRSATTYSDLSGTTNGMIVVQATREDQTSNNTSDVLTTVTRYYREDTADAFFRSQIHSVTRPDGVKVAYAYQRGTWNGSFTKSNNNGLNTGVASRVAVITGTTNSGAGSLFSTYDGYDIDDLHRTETHVWTGTGWALVGATDFTYNHFGFLTSRVSLNGGAYSANYSRDQMSTDTDETGVTVSYTYDAAGRLDTATKASGGPITHPVKTTFTYNAASQVLSETISSTGTSEVIVNSRTYDSAGRLQSVTPAGLSSTQFSYSPSTRTETVTAPNNSGTKTTTLQLDGRLASVTGSAVVAQYYTYSVESDGRRLTQVTFGSSNSPRWTRSWSDWVGRAVKSEKPGFSPSGQANFIEENFYDDATIGKGRLFKTTRTGFAPTRYEYDALSNVVRSGLDLVGNNGLRSDTNDRISESDTYFEEHDGAWWIRSDSKIYPTTNSAAAVDAGFTRTRLTGFSGTLRREIQVTDGDGNLTKTTVAVERSLKTVTTTIITTGITDPSVTVTVNGVTDHATGFDGLTTEAEYDSLGRPWKSIDTRNKPTTTSYLSGTSLVSSIQDAAGHFVRRFGYDSVGRIAWTQDASDYTTRYAYNERGQLLRQWGAGAYPIEYGYDPTYGDRTSMKTYRGGTNWDAATWEGITTGSADTTTWDFDAASALLWKKTHASSPPVTFDYNHRGQVKSRTWARGVVTNYRYFGDDPGDDPTGELKRVSYTNDPNSTPAVDYTYTRLGQIDGVTDQAGTWDYVYDSAKPWRQSATGLPAIYGNRTWTPLYESTGMVGRFRGFQLGATVGGSDDLEQSYTFTNSGRFDTLTTKRASNAISRTFDYDYETNAPWVKSLAITGGHAFSVTRTYDGTRPLLTAIETKWSTTSQVRFDYGYNALRQRSHAQMSGSVFEDYYQDYTGSDKAVTRYFSYNSRGELETETMHRKAAVATPAASDGLPGRRHEYRYDSIGNRRTSGQTGSAATGDESYTVNALNQYESRENHSVRVTGTAAPGAIVAVQSAASTNKLDRAWAADILPANGDNAVKGTAKVFAVVGGTNLIRTHSAPFFIPKATQTFGYDADGNMTHDSVWNYFYDAENRLIAMEHRSEVIGAGMILESDARRLGFRYDYKGRRVKKTVRRGWNHLTSTYDTWDSETRYFYDGWNLVAEFSAANEEGSTLALKKSYTWGLDLTGSLTASGGVGALLQIHDHTAGKTLLPAYDGNGNVVALFDATSGAVEARYEYGPFGEVVRAEGTYAQGNSFRFSTKFTDNESGLVYYGLRYYSPSFGRFINRDPSQERGGLNLYGFVRNDPLNSIDFLGLNRRNSGPKGGVGLVIIYKSPDDVQNAHGPGGDSQGGDTEDPKDSGSKSDEDVIGYFSDGTPGTRGEGNAWEARQREAYRSAGEDVRFGSIGAMSVLAYLGFDGNWYAWGGVDRAGNGETASAPNSAASGGGVDPLVVADVANNAVGFAATVATGTGAQLAARQAAQGGAHPSFRGVNVQQMREMARTGNANAARLATAGRVATGVGVGVSVALAGADMINSGFSNRSFSRTGVSAAITFIAIAGGPVGAGAALAFSGLNALGAFDGFYNYFDNRSRIGNPPPVAAPPRG